METNKEKVHRLKGLLINYEDECDTLEDMQEAWNKYRDPGSDSGSRCKQELRISEAYGNIKDFVLQFM
jgi:hypothetical protein